MNTHLEELIRYAVLAPSGHNTQPWRFSVQAGGIGVHADLSRRLPVVDPDDHALYISLGCALENLLIAAAHHGFTATIEDRPDSVYVALRPDGSEEGTELLFRALGERQSNRRVYDTKPIPEEHIEALVAANGLEGVETRVVRVRDTAIEPIIELVREGSIAQFRDAAFVRELVSWIRFSRAAVAKHGDGLSAQSFGLPPIPGWLGRLIMTRIVTPAGEAARQERAVRSSALVMAFVAGANDRRHWIDTGRAFERVALTATSLGIAHAHVNMPCEVEAVRLRLAEHFGLRPGEQPLLLIRFGYATPMPRSARRPLQDVIVAA